MNAKGRNTGALLIALYYFGVPYYNNYSIVSPQNPILIKAPIVSSQSTVQTRFDDRSPWPWPTSRLRSHSHFHPKMRENRNEARGARIRLGESCRILSF